MDISTTTKLRNDIARLICREVCDDQGFERSKLYLDAADSILAMVDKAQNPPAAARMHPIFEQELTRFKINARIDAALARATDTGRVGE